MSRSGPQKIRYESSSNGSIDEANEGTSARTRPLSFDEIMLKRKSKKLSEDVKEGARGAGKVYLKSTIEVVGGHLVGDRSNNYGRDSNLGDRKTVSNYVHTPVSRKKEEKSRKEEDHSTARKREGRDMDTKWKLRLEKDAGHKTETDGRGHDKSKVDEKSRNHSEFEHENKHFNDPKGEYRFIDRSKGKSDGGSKRKERTEDVEKYVERHDLKKHDSGRRHVLESVVRKTKTQSYSHHEEAKLKRRRSRSQDHAKDRYRRSGSSSPRDPEHLSHKESYGRHHFDADKNKISSNGSSSHYRRHGGSSSGLGGYSPRKRKTEAAVKTPSPPKRSPEKKSAAWDLPPVGADRTLANTNHSGALLSLKTKSSTAVDPGGIVPVAHNVAKSPFVLDSNTLSLVKSASIDSIQLTQATRPMRRLYIENVPSSVSERDIMECLNNFLLSSGANHIQGTKPCISCMIHKEKGQALVEFLTPEDASAALSFDGRSFYGYDLKIRRPKDFNDVATGSSDKSKGEADSIVSHSINDFVKDSPHKIFIGGISPAVSSEMLMEITAVFGPLKSYHFEVNKLVNEPCAFLEYADQSITLKACAGLNGIKIGGRVLTVAQAVPNAISMDDSGSPPSYGIPEHVKPLLEKPTPVLKIKNVVAPEATESLSEAELEEILEDVRLECARFGSVKSINFIKSIPIAPEPHEVVRDDTGSCQSLQDLGLAQQNLSVESREGDDQDTGGITIVEPLKEVEERSENDEMVEGNLNLANERCSSTGHTVVENKSETIVQEASNQEDAGRDSMKPYQAVVIDSRMESNVKSNPNTEDPSELGEVNEKVQEGVKSSDGERIDKTESVLDLGNVFEAGCVLVEFRRSEASCMAAHCLHGRAFDDRVVLVEYIPVDLYKSRFPK
ncbi:hypothetical protein Dimus_000953 [Dionaea muscipula]